MRLELRLLLAEEWDFDALLFEELRDFDAAPRAVPRWERDELPPLELRLLLEAALLRDEEREDALRGGTLSPSRRASERPIATACFGLVTFLPLRPLRSLPFFISRISS